MKTHKQLYIATLINCLALTAHAVDKASEARMDEIAQRGMDVMPFNLEQTVHVFSKKDYGGLQQVVVKEKSNTEQIKLIREHLAEIALDFQQGNFSDPTRLHGENMPGLANLKNAKPGQIIIEYMELRDGAQISYKTIKPDLIDAIHLWFDAQLRDHARHAMPHHPHHQMHSQ